jgi:hypothetical protein
VFSQVAGALPLQSGSGNSFPMYEQCPTDPVSLHDTQGPLHAMLQQTPSTQNPDRQPLASSQTAPLVLLPHELAEH